MFDLDDTLYDKSGQVSEDNYWWDVEKITLFPGAKEFLENFPARKILLSKEAIPGLQKKKIEVLGIKIYFEEIIFCFTDEEKKKILQKIKIQDPGEEIWVVGDRLDSELKFAQELGLKTVWLKQGKYKNLKSSLKPNHTILKFKDLREVLKKQK